MSKKQFYVCSCFFTHNFFIQRYNCHVIYRDEKQFTDEYKTIFKNKGCTTEGAWNSVLSDIRCELNRRRSLANDSLQREAMIKASYKPLYPEVYKIESSFFDETFLQLVEDCKLLRVNRDEIAKRLSVTGGKKIYSFPVFSKEFCDKFMAEIEHFEKSDLPKARPNTMNNYGIMLNELGFDEGFLTPFRVSYMQPITSLLYPECGGDSLDTHKAFVVQYKEKEDLDLAYHFDNAEVTINVSLGKDYGEGELYFGDMADVDVMGDNKAYTRYVHQPTHGLLHRGQHKHGAMPISRGERYNLIVWMRSSTIRNKRCPMCNNKPELVPHIRWGDGFTDDTDRVENVCTAI